MSSCLKFNKFLFMTARYDFMSGGHYEDSIRPIRRGKVGKRENMDMNTYSEMQVIGMT